MRPKRSPAPTPRRRPNPLIPRADRNPAKTFAGSEANPAKTFLGSEPPVRFAAARYHDAILEKRASGLTAQRIWQDLTEEFGYGHSYESIKRYLRTVAPRGRAVGVFESEPGQEGQVDFFRGAPTFDAATGQWKRPWVFRLTLSCSRHGYEEAVWDQQLATFLRLHERAFRDLNGVPSVVRLDNLKSGVLRACFYDPDVNEVYTAFAQHWGFTPLPIQPRRPQENGKQERSGGYVKDNALKGHRFDSLDAHNAHLRHWNQTIARLRIHGTTRRQVWTHFVEVERPALRTLAAESFPLFRCGERTVHPDGHVEVDGAYYPVPAQLLGEVVRAQWDDHLVRVYHRDVLMIVHARVGDKEPTTPAGDEEPAADPTTASRKLSTRRSLTSRHREAPSTMRTLNSWWRVVARASSRFAMFAQATSSTSAATPSNVTSSTFALARSSRTGAIVCRGISTCSISRTRTTF